MEKSELTTKLKEAENAEKADNFFAAAFFYRDSLQLAIKLQDSKLIKLCKNKIVEMNKKSIASGKDYKEVEITQEISKEHQETLSKLIEGILSLENITAILKLIGEHPFFFPKVAEVEAQAKKTIPLAYQLATLATVSNQGHTIRGSSDGSYAWFMKMYAISQELIMTMYLDRIFHSLIYSKSKKIKLNSKKLEIYFSDSKIIDPEQMKIISVGLQRYFKKDYVSAMHILIPQLEALFLSLAQKCGIDIVAVDRKIDTATRTTTLSEHHLDSKEFKDIFGEDFCKQIKFILFEPMGYKLRHKIAHGEVHHSECNFRTVNLVLYIYLVLISRASIVDK